MKSVAAFRLSIALVLFAAFGVIATNCFAFSSPQQKPDRYIERARQYIEENYFEGAEKNLKRALEIQPDSAEAMLLLGKVFRAKNEFDVAIAYVREAIKHQPDFAEAHFLLAIFLYDKHDFENALGEVETAIAQGMNSPEVFIFKGKAQLAMKQFDPSIASYETALVLAKAQDQTRLQKYIEGLKRCAEFSKKSEDILAGDPNNKRPVPLNRPRPGYTEEARKAKVQGRVQLVLSVDEQGRVSDALVLCPIGYGLDEEAEKAARQMLFSPASIDGKPAPFWVRIEIEFNLR